jgi:hypothetical protein
MENLALHAAAAATGNVVSGGLTLQAELGPRCVTVPPAATQPAPP